MKRHGLAVSEYTKGNAYSIIFYSCCSTINERFCSSYMDEYRETSANFSIYSVWSIIGLKDNV
jgi:hypothetical protein